MEVYWTPTELTGGDNYQITFGSTMRLSILFNFWDDYVNNPGDPSYYMIVESRLRSMFQYVLKLAEYHLA